MYRKECLLLVLISFRNESLGVNEVKVLLSNVHLAFNVYSIVRMCGANDTRFILSTYYIKWQYCIGRGCLLPKLR